MAKKSKSGLPSRIECTKCKAKKGVRPDVLEKRIAKFGSLEKLQEVYVCRSCKKEHNLDAGFRKKPTKRKYRKASERDYRRVDPHDGVLKYFWEHHEWKKKQIDAWFAKTGWPEETVQKDVRYGPACHRPDINIAQNYFCGTEKGDYMCPLYDQCDCPKKKLAKFPKKIEAGKKTPKHREILKKNK
jgi:hypothetical protein